MFLDQLSHRTLFAAVGALHYNFCLTIHAKHSWIAALLQLGDVFSCCVESRSKNKFSIVLVP